MSSCCLHLLIQQNSLLGDGIIVFLVYLSLPWKTHSSFKINFKSRLCLEMLLTLMGVFPLRCSCSLPPVTSRSYFCLIFSPWVVIIKWLINQPHSTINSFWAEFWVVCICVFRIFSHDSHKSAQKILLNKWMKASPTLVNRAIAWIHYSLIPSHFSFARL